MGRAPVSHQAITRRMPLVVVLFLLALGERALVLLLVAVLSRLLPSGEVGVLVLVVLRLVLLALGEVAGVLLLATVLLFLLLASGEVGMGLVLVFHLVHLPVQRPPTGEAGAGRAPPSVRRSAYSTQSHVRVTPSSPCWYPRSTS